MGKASENHINRARLTWVLAALVASMTIGTVVLAVLEPNRIVSNKIKYLAATYNSASSEKINNTTIPIESKQWQAIVIHTIRDDLKLHCLSENINDCDIVHFAISPQAEILITTKWASQQPVRHYKNTIHIGIELPKGKDCATLAQAQALVALIIELQARCNIPADNVFLHGQLSSHVRIKNPLYRYNWRKAIIH